jgi:NTP pyrophosphatase (non-canonical NTP hydrolase)
MKNHPTIPSTHFTETFKNYQKVAQETAIYSEEIAIDYLTTGLAGEVGEFTSIVAKQLRKGNYSRGPWKATNLKAYPLDDVAGELGDILWFVSQLATTFELDLADIANKNLAKLKSRKKRGVIEGSGDYR